MTKETRKYKKVSCHTSTSAARKAANTLRNEGYTAVVKKLKNGACVYSKGKRKVVIITHSKQMLAGVRKRRKQVNK